MRRLIVCCDGTWNEPDKDGRGTNVVKISQAISPSDPNGRSQRVHYQPGVGTGPVGRLSGGALGLGISRDIRECYEFLCHNYQGEDEEIFILGFSRGAYAARSLVGFVAGCGLIRLAAGETGADISNRVDEAYRAYRAGAAEAAAFKRRPEVNSDVPIRFLGVWDTVGALGIPDHLLLDSLDQENLFQFHNTELSHQVETARHAVSLDEMRESYVPTLWSNAQSHPDAREIWFAGVHSDIGGGYDDPDLGNITLNWMMDEASSAGLSFEASPMSPPENPSGQLHDSAKSQFWQMLGLRPRGTPRLSDSDRVHETVRVRQRDQSLRPSYRPEKRQEMGKAVSVQVASEARWNNTGLFLEEGETYHFVATGVWKDASWTTDADGFSDGGVAHKAAQFIEKAVSFLRRRESFSKVRLPFTRRVPELNWFSLVGVIASESAQHGDDYETFLIGKEKTYTAKNAGYLYCFANDTWQTYERNNEGSVELTVTLTN